MNNDNQLNEISNDGINHYETKKEVDKDIISNEEILKKKINGIMSDLDDINNHEENRKKFKNVLLIIVTIIEAIIIFLIIKKTLLK